MSADLITTGKSCFGGAKKKIKKKSGTKKNTANKRSKSKSTGKKNGKTKKSTNNKRSKTKSTAKKSKSNKRSKKSTGKNSKSKSKSKKSTGKKSTGKKSKSKSKTKKSSKTKRSNTKSKSKKGKKRRILVGNNSREMQRQLRELHAIEKEILDRRNIEEQIYKEQMAENLKHEQRLRLQMRKPTPFRKASSPKRENITLSIKEPSVRESSVRESSVREPSVREQDILNTIEKSPELSYEGDLSYRD